MAIKKIKVNGVEHDIYATYDAMGRNIANTYATKSEASNATGGTKVYLHTYHLVDPASPDDGTNIFFSIYHTSPTQLTMFDLRMFIKGKHFFAYAYNPMNPDDVYGQLQVDDDHFIVKGVGNFMGEIMLSEVTLAIVYSAIHSCDITEI